MIGRLKEPTVNRDGTMNIIISTDSDFSALYEELKECEVEVEIKKRNRKRSLDANAFAWVLIDKIADKTGLSKIEVYREAIRGIGGVSDIVCVQDKAVDRLVSGWHKNGLGWQTETFPSRLEGCTNVVLYYGSSVYDSRQMSMLIDNLIQDAETLGIPTISEEETKRLLGTWKPKGGK